MFASDQVVRALIMVLVRGAIVGKNSAARELKAVLVCASWETPRAPKYISRQSDGKKPSIPVASKIVRIVMKNIERDPCSKNGIVLTCVLQV